MTEPLRHQPHSLPHSGELSYTTDPRTQLAHIFRFFTSDSRLHKRRQIFAPGIFMDLSVRPTTIDYVPSDTPADATTLLRVSIHELPDAEIPSFLELIHAGNPFDMTCFRIPPPNVAAWCRQQGWTETNLKSRVFDHIDLKDFTFSQLTEAYRSRKNQSTPEA